MESVENESFIMTVLTDLDYEQAAEKFKRKKVAGVDKIPSYVLKTCSELLRKPLMHIFNLILKSKIFPSIWKNYICVPIHKSGNMKEIGNYRAVCIICAPSKLFKHIIYIHAYVSACRKNHNERTTWLYDD